MGIDTNLFQENFPDLAALIDPDILERFCQRLNEEQISKGDTLLEFGAPSDTMYMVMEGKLTVSLDAGDSDVVLGEICQGQFVNEVSLLAPGPASATLIAVEDTKAVTLGHLRFDGFARENPADASSLFKELSMRLARRTRAATASLVQYDDGGKLTVEQPPEQPKSKLVQLLAGLFGLGDQK